MNNDRASVTPLALADSVLKTAGHFLFPVEDMNTSSEAYPERYIQ